MTVYNIKYSNYSDLFLLYHTTTTIRSKQTAAPKHQNKIDKIS